MLLIYVFQPPLPRLTPRSTSRALSQRARPEKNVHHAHTLPLPKPERRLVTGNTAQAQCQAHCT
jgi:hypothetical protein